MKKVLISLSALALLGSSSAALAATAPATSPANLAANAAAAKEAAKLAKKAAAAKAKAAKLARAAAAARAKADANPGNMKLAALAAKAEQQAAAAEAEASAYEAAAAAASSGDLAAAAAAVSAAPAASAAAAVSTSASSSAIAAASVELLDDEDEDEIEEVDSSAADEGPSKAERRAANEIKRKEAREKRAAAVAARIKAIEDAAAREKGKMGSPNTIENAKETNYAPDATPGQKAEADLLKKIEALKVILQAAKETQTQAQSTFNSKSTEYDTKVEAKKTTAQTLSAKKQAEEDAKTLETKAKDAHSKVKTAKTAFDKLTAELAQNSGSEPSAVNSQNLAEAFLKDIEAALNDINFYVSDKDADGNEGVAGQGVEGAKTSGKAHELEQARKALADVLGEKGNDGSNKEATLVYKALNDLEAANKLVTNRAGTATLTKTLTDALGGTDNKPEGSTMALADKAKTAAEAVAPNGDNTPSSEQVQSLVQAVNAIDTDLADRGRVADAIAKLKQDPGVQQSDLTELDSKLSAAKSSVTTSQKANTALENARKVKDLTDKMTEKLTAIGIPADSNCTPEQKPLCQAKAAVGTATSDATVSSPASLSSAVLAVRTGGSEAAKPLPDASNIQDAISKLKALKTATGELLTASNELKDSTALGAEGEPFTKAGAAQVEANALNTAVQEGIEAANKLNKAVKAAKPTPGTTKTGDDVDTAKTNLSQSMAGNSANPAIKGIEPAATEAKTKVEAVAEEAKTQLSAKAKAAKEAVTKTPSDTSAVENAIKALSTEAKNVAEKLTEEKAKTAASTLVKGSFKTEIEKIEKTAQGSTDPKLLTTLKEKANASETAETQKVTEASTAVSNAQKADKEAQQAIDTAQQEKSEAEKNLNTAKEDAQAYEGFDKAADEGYKKELEAADKLEKEAKRLDEELDSE